MAQQTKDDHDQLVSGMQLRDHHHDAAADDHWEVAHSVE
jgi:hypothetical protein